MSRLFKTVGAVLCLIFRVCFASPAKPDSLYAFIFSSRRRHTIYWRDWSSDVCSSDLSGDLITYMEATDAEEEAMYVADRILFHQKADPSVRIAVLYRTNFLSRVLEEKLRRYNMKYRIVGGFSFYERAEIKDLISYLTVSLNPDDSVHLLRVINTPPRGIGKTTTDILEELAVERGTSLWGAIEIAVEQPRLPMRTIRALEAFHSLIAEFGLA